MKYINEWNYFDPNPEVIITKLTDEILESYQKNVADSLDPPFNAGYLNINPSQKSYSPSGEISGSLYFSLNCKSTSNFEYLDSDPIRGTQLKKSVELFELHTFPKPVATEAIKGSIVIDVPIGKGTIGDFFDIDKKIFSPNPIYRKPPQYPNENLNTAYIKNVIVDFTEHARERQWRHGILEKTDISGRKSTVYYDDGDLIPLPKYISTDKIVKSSGATIKQALMEVASGRLKKNNPFVAFNTTNGITMVGTLWGLEDWVKYLKRSTSDEKMFYDEYRNHNFLVFEIRTLWGSPDRQFKPNSGQLRMNVL